MSHDAITLSSSIVLIMDVNPVPRLPVPITPILIRLFLVEREVVFSSEKDG
jgi:hypothetical protein